MDSIPDLPPVTDPSPQPHFASPTTNGAHPPYPDMIEAAIVTLKDRDGSSRQAIAKYIERHYANLPPTHSTLLTYHLKRMKNEGQLTMVKHSYMLPAPRSVPFESSALAPTMDHDIADYSVTSTDTFGTSPGFKAENSSVQPRRKPGRPPKPRHEFGFQVQNQLPDEQPATAIPPYQPQFEQHLGSGQDFHPQNPLGAPTHDQPTYASGQEFQGNYAGGAEPIFASLGLADDGVTVAPPLQSPEKVVVSAKRGRGRPPKVNRPVVTSSGDGGADGVSGGGADGVSGGGADGGGGGGEVEAERRVKRKVGRPKLMSMMMFNGGGKKRGVGRPKRIGRPVTVPLSGNVIGRGRPKKTVSDHPAQNVSVNGGDGEGEGGGGGGGSVSRGRGRPRKSFSSANKVEKSFGWPNEFRQGTSVIVTDPHQLVAFQELKSKYEHLQSKAREVLSVARPYINADYAAIGVLQELETLLRTDTDNNAAA